MTLNIYLYDNHKLRQITRVEAASVVHIVKSAALVSYVVKGTEDIDDKK